MTRAVEKPQAGKRQVTTDQIISWALLAIGSLVVSFNFNRYVTHSHQQYIAVIFPFFLAAAVSLIFLLKRASAYLQTRAAFDDYLSFFGYVALACIPWSFSFAFDSGMAFFMTVLQLLLVSTAFLIKFNPEIPRFSIVVGSWSGIFLILGVPLAHYIKQVGNDGEKIVAEAEPSPEKTEAAVAANDTPANVTPSAAVQAAAPAPTGIPVVVTKPAVDPNSQMAQANALHQEVQAALEKAQPSAQTLMASAPPSAEKVQDAMANEEYFQAAKSGNLPVLRALVDRKAVDPNFTLDHGMTGLMYAAANGNVSIVRYLLSKKVTINAQDPNGTTALMWASYKGKIKVVAALLKAGADQTIKRDDGDTALEIAKKWKQHDIASLLQTYANGARAIASSPSRKRR
jgi:hypothetical protein